MYAGQAEYPGAITFSMLIWPARNSLTSWIISNYQTTLSPLSDHSQPTIKPLSDHYQTTIRPLPLSDHYHILMILMGK